MIRPGTKPITYSSGFTLIELSIVLVIIGLIVGGVLVGKSLLDAAEKRSLLNAINEYNAAINTFRDKYNGLPGDLVNATDFFDVSTNIQNGDGNRFIRNNHSAPYRGESINAHLELKFSGLIPNAAPAPVPAYAYWWVEAPKVGRFNIGIGTPVVVPDANRTDNWILVGKTQGSLNTSLSPILSSMETYLLDIKIDDGISSSGKFKATGFSGNSSNCITSTSWAGNYTYDEEYILTASHLTTHGCVFSITLY